MTMKTEPVHTDSAPAAIGPYSQAMKCGDMLFCSGQFPLDPATMEMVGSDAFWRHWYDEQPPAKGASATTNRMLHKRVPDFIVREPRKLPGNDSKTRLNGQ